MHLKDSHPVVLAFVRFKFRFIFSLRTSPVLKLKGKTGILLFKVSDTPFGTRKTERRFGKGLKIYAERQRESGHGGYPIHPRMKRRKVIINSVKHSSLLRFSLLSNSHHFSSFPLFFSGVPGSWFLTPFGWLTG